MIVLRRLAHGVWDHAGVRFTEWIGGAALMGIGYAFYAEPDAIYSTRSFTTLAGWAQAVTWSNLLLTCGLIRLIALGVNGTFQGFRHSPTIRFIAACTAATFWMLFTAGVYTAWRDFGGSPTGPVIYGCWTALELRNAYVSRVDMASTRGRGQYAGANR